MLCGMLPAPSFKRTAFLIFFRWAIILRSLWGWLKTKLWVCFGFCFCTAIGAVQVREYAIAGLLLILSGISLLAYCAGWPGIPAHRTITNLLRIVLGLGGLVLLCFSPVWVHREKGQDSWSMFLKRDPLASKTQAVNNAPSLTQPARQVIPRRSEIPNTVPDVPKQHPAHAQPKEIHDDVSLTVSIVNPTSPAILIENTSAAVADGVIWELVMFRRSDHAFLSYITQSVGFVKPHSKSALQEMDLNVLPRAPGGSNLSDGDVCVGTLLVDCPSCKGTTLVVSFNWHISGWFREIYQNGRLLVPHDMTPEGIDRFAEFLDQQNPEKRIAIQQIAND